MGNLVYETGIANMGNIIAGVWRLLLSCTKLQPKAQFGQFADTPGNR